MHYASNAMALDPTKPTITAKNGDRITPSDDFTEVAILNPPMPHYKIPITSKYHYAKNRLIFWI